MTTVRLAYGGPRNAAAKGMNDEQHKPALLVSYHYIKDFLVLRPRLSFRDWVMDSGAFSAANIGATINLRAYGETALELLASDPTMVEVYSLDVIGDTLGTLKNTAKLHEMGVPAIPTFHVGGKVKHLRQMAKEFDKVALGGAVGYRKKFEWAQLCFKEVWPKAIHGFGFGSREHILGLPWHSVDATNWEIGPTKFGVWRGLSRGGLNKQTKMSVRGGDQDLRSEVDHYLRIEREARQKWRKQMEGLGDVTVRLAVIGSGREPKNLGKEEA